MYLDPEYMIDCGACSRHSSVGGGVFLQDEVCYLRRLRTGLVLRWVLLAELSSRKWEVGGGVLNGQDREQAGK